MADPIVEVVTNLGTFVIQLDATRAPKSVANFLHYVDAKHYDGTVFHRVIAGFMIQGGGFDKSFKQKPTRPSVPIESKNGLKNDVGWLAMARTNDPNSPHRARANAVTGTFSPTWCRRSARRQPDPAAPSRATCRASRS